MANKAKINTPPTIIPTMIGTLEEEESDDGDGDEPPPPPPEAEESGDLCDGE